MLREDGGGVAVENSGIISSPVITIGFRNFWVLSFPLYATGNEILYVPGLALREKRESKGSVLLPLT